MKNAKHEYNVVIDSKNELEKYLDVMKYENEVLKLELEEKYKALDNCLNENVAMNVVANRHSYHMYANRHFKKKHAHTTCYECGRKSHIAFYCFYKEKILFSRKFRFLKVPNFN